MTRAIRIHKTGGPGELRWEEIEVPEPARGEVRLRQVAVGLNYIDLYHRSGLYPLPGLPHVLGMEGAGTIEAVGPEVTDLRPGDRVAYASAPIGAYAEIRNMPVERLVPLPDGIDEHMAAAMMLRGMTVEYLVRRTFEVKPGDTVLVHAAAGGIGLLACQWLKSIGATVIGTVGSAEKARLASSHGCDHVILYHTEDFAARVREITHGVGVPVVYDGVGRDTFQRSLDCLRPRGLLVLFGNASGPVDNFNAGLLAQKGSLYLTRPTLLHYTATRRELLDSAAALFNVVRSGAVKVEIGQSYPLAEAARAHRDLEARRTTGSTILLV